MNDPAHLYKSEAQRIWDRARRKALWQRLNASLRGKQIQLLDFDDVSQRLRLRSARYKGVKSIPLNKIVGSVGRYHDFVTTFLPVTHEMEERWRKVAALYLNPNYSLPPIDVYKVGESYFVKDGNHRVSIAHQIKLPDIDAHVWEYPLPVGDLPPDADIDTVIIEIERQEFLQTTRIDELRPDHNIRVTVPGGYPELLEQIAHYQEILMRIDQETVPYDAAVTAWYDMVYETTLEVIEESGILRSFPNRTPADVFVWLTRYQHDLEDQYGRKGIRMSQVAQKFELEKSAPLQRFWKRLKQRLNPSK